MQNAGLTRFPTITEATAASGHSLILFAFELISSSRAAEDESIILKVLPLSISSNPSLEGVTICGAGREFGTRSRT